MQKLDSVLGILHANFKKEHKGLLLKQMLWNCASASTKEEFKLKMAELKDENEKAFEWLSQKYPKEWSRSQFKTLVKSDMLLNNLCESFNNAILMARDKPIVTLLEKIRFWLMCRFAKKRDAAQKWKTPVGPRIMEIIEKHKNVSRYCQSTLAGNSKFQVLLIHCFSIH